MFCELFGIGEVVFYSCFFFDFKLVFDVYVRDVVVFRFIIVRVSCVFVVGVECYGLNEGVYVNVW